MEFVQQLDKPIHPHPSGFKVDKLVLIPNYWLQIDFE